MQMPMPPGNPVRLPADVAGSLSRMQGLLQAAQPEIQTAYATHWLAMRQAAGVPGFQEMTQNLLWGLYGANALGGLLRFALSGRATPEVMGGIIDQVHLLQESYGRATQAFQQFLEQPETADFPTVPVMAQGLRHLDRVYQQMREPGQTVVNSLPWVPGGPVNGLPVQRASLTWGSEEGQPSP